MLERKVQRLQNICIARSRVQGFVYLFCLFKSETYLNNHKFTSRVEQLSSRRAHVTSISPHHDQVVLPDVALEVEGADVVPLCPGGFPVDGTLQHPGVLAGRPADGADVE